MRARFSRLERIALDRLEHSFGSRRRASKLVTPGYLFNSDPPAGRSATRFYLFTTQDPFTVEFNRPNTFFRMVCLPRAHDAGTSILDRPRVDLTGRDVSWNAGAHCGDGDAVFSGERPFLRLRNRSVSTRTPKRITGTTLSVCFPQQNTSKDLTRISMADR